MSDPRLIKFRIRKFGKEIDPSEILLDSLAHKKEREWGISEKRLETPISRRILQGFLVGFIIFLAFIFGKTFQLQVLEGKEYSQLAKENQFVVRLIKAERGIIYDRNMAQLVFNSPSFNLVVRPLDLPETESERIGIIGQVAKIIGMEFRELDDKIAFSDVAQAVVADGLSHQNVVLLESKKEELPGFEVVNSAARQYLSGPVFSHLLGYKRKTGQKTSLESYYDDLLDSKPGELYIERDVHGRPLSKEIVSMPESGKSLVLWLDSGLQEKVTEAMERSLKNIGARKAAAVALDPKTGGVLAMVSLPGYDNNLFSSGISPEEWQQLRSDPANPFLNRVISGRYLTGSTIKPLIASAVLEEGIISPEKKIYDSLGYIIIPNPWVENASTTKKDWAIHGWTDMRKAIAESCNVYFYTVGGGYRDQEGLGPTKIKEYLGLFGWNKKTGIDLPGEAQGFVPDTGWKKQTWGQDWWDGDTYNMAIGQGFLQITPLEVAASFVAIANGGKFLQPAVLKAVIDSDKNVIKEVEPKIVRENFISPQNLQVVREGMRQAVTGAGSPLASSVYLNSLPVKAAAKTGTAQLGNNRNNHWITVFAPYDDPQIVLTLLVEDIEGLPAAVLPPAREILEWYFSPKE